MSSLYRRYEILLPLKFNDGLAVPNKLIGTTLLELRTKFGAVSAETQTIQGTWSYLGQEYQDELIRVFVDVEDERTTREYFVSLKEELKARFQQVDIWITSYPVDVI